MRLITGSYFNKNNLNRATRPSRSDRAETHIRSVTGDIVEFCDGSKKRADMIIFCTGYHNPISVFLR